MAGRAPVGRGDHPRIRGEHMASVRHSSSVSGSSPHTRGARDLVGVAGINSGIIPAYAGSTLLLAGADRELEDHPRIRGEHRI